MVSVEVNNNFKKKEDDELYKIKHLISEMNKNIGNQDLKQKCSIIAVQSKENGNNLFLQNNHNRQMHFEILSFYNKSIAFAPSNSEELAVALNNRSVLLLHLKEYESCFFDIEDALNLTKSSYLQGKLMCRKVKCALLLGDQNAKEIASETKIFLKKVMLNQKLKQKLIGNFNNTIKSTRKERDRKTLDNLELPKMISSDEIPCATEAISLKYNGKYGRHIVANRQISTGEVIAIEDGYVLYPNTELIYMLCSHCLRFVFNIIPCEHCSYAMYCSKECRNTAYEKYHDIECSLNPLLFFDCNSKLDARFLMYVRLFVAVMKEGSFLHIMNEIGFVDNYTDYRKKGFSNNGKFESHRFRSFYSLTDNALECNNNLLSIVIEDFSSLCIRMFHHYTTFLKDVYRTSDNYLFLKKLFIKLSNLCLTIGHNVQGGICSCYLNSVHKYDCLFNRGGFISSFASLLNHSCHPNASIFVIEGKIVIYSCRPIKKNDQIFCSFGPNMTLSKCDRQRYLSEKYHFNCSCEACSENWPILDYTLALSVDVELFTDQSVLNCLKSIEDLKHLAMASRVYKYELFKKLCKLVDLVYSSRNNQRSEIGTLYIKHIIQSLLGEFYVKEIDIPLFCS